MSDLADIWSWLSGKSRAARRKGQSIFERLVKGGAKKSEAKARALFGIEPRPEQWRKLSPSELEAAGFSRASKRYTTAPKGGRIKAAQTISEKAVRNKRALAETGTPLKSSEAPTRLAAGQRPYKSAASEAAMEKRKAWRKRVSRRGDFKETVATHAFIDREGREQREMFSGRSLAIMQEYRRDWNAALRLNDEALLERYARLRIVTHGGLPVHPATKIRIIRDAKSRMTLRKRNRFDADVFYANGEMELAA